MAIQKEIWASAISEGMFADNSFMSRSVDASEYIVGKKVHWPQAGAPSNVVKNRSGKGEASGRTDTDLTYDIDNYSTDPKYIKNAEEIQLSYNKRESVIKLDRAKLHDQVAQGMIYGWLPTTNKVKTSGAAVVAHTPGATGNRKSFTVADVLATMTFFDTKNVPQEGRCMLLDAQMYSQLIKSMTAQESQAFHAAVDVQRGVVGKLHGFDIYKRSTVGVYASDGTKKEYGVNGGAADCAAGLAWQETLVARSASDVNVYENENDAHYYGSVYSFDLLAGGKCIMSSEVGVCAIVQSATA